MYRKIRDTVQKFDMNDVLRLEMKAIKDKDGPSGIVKVLLVLNFIPRFPLKPRDLPDKRDCMIEWKLFRKDIFQNTARSSLIV